MRRRLFSLIVLFTISFGTTGRSSADDTVDTVGNLSGVEILTSVDRTESYIGDLINYTITITYDSSLRLIPPPLGANLGMFEVKDYEPDVETRLDNGRVQNQTKFVLSTYTTGDYIIPPLPVLFILPDSTRKLMVSEALPITILSLLGDGADSLSLKGPGSIGSLRGTKAPFEFKRDYTWHYIFGALGLLLIIGLVWYWRRRRHREVDLVDPREAWEIAFEKMALLKERRFIEEGSFKAYYIALTELTREYLGRIFNCETLEMTTGEFAGTFEEFIKPAAAYERTVDFMRHADLVKFAKLVPEREQAETDYLFVHELVSDIRDEYLRKLEAERLAETARLASKSKTPEAEIA